MSTKKATMSTKQTTKQRNASISCVEEAASELHLTISNDGDMYDEWQKIVRGLLAKKQPGRSRAEASVVAYNAFLPYVKDGGRKYQREVGKTAFDMTSDEVVDEATRLFVQEFEMKNKAGDLDWLGGSKRKNPGQPKTRAANPDRAREKFLLDPLGGRR